MKKGKQRHIFGEDFYSANNEFVHAKKTFCNTSIVKVGFVETEPNHTYFVVLENPSICASRSVFYRFETVDSSTPHFEDLEKPEDDGGKDSNLSRPPLGKETTDRLQDLLIFVSEVNESLPMAPRNIVSSGNMKKIKATAKK